LKDNEFPLLMITDIEWDKDHDDFENLPTNFELKWGSKNWDIDSVSDWISQKFDWIFNKINIQQVGTWQQESG
tara:strand:+ start:208 stop:426 length:219 start_codon:yes stop_codon:yes gene_type:complete